MKPSDTSIQGNPFVGYLNSLRTQSEGGNPGYVEEIRRPSIERLRREHPWFPSIDELHVATRLDALVDALVEGSTGFDLVVLTGDAGDGKTAVCARLAERLGVTRELGVRETVNRWTILKDASEVPEAILVEAVEAALTGDGRGLVVAINEGRLRRLALRATKASETMRGRLRALWDKVIEPSLRSNLDAEDAAALDCAMNEHRTAVVNFRHRMHVRTVTPGLLRVWSQPQFWEESPGCGACPAKGGCPIFANIQDVRRPDVQERVSDVLAAAHYAGQRLPFRRLQATLALGVTGGLSCSDIDLGGRLHGEDLHLERLRHRFYDVLFPQEVRRLVSVRTEPVTRVLRATDPGIHSDDQLDAEINALAAAPPAEGALPTLGGERLGPLELAALAQVGEALGPLVDDRQHASAEVLAEFTRALRRWRGLRGAPRKTAWRESLNLLELYANAGDGEDLRRKSVGALNALQRLGATNETRITGRQVDPMGFRDPDRLDLELDLGTEFEVAMRSGPHLPSAVKPWLESSASEVELEAWPAQGARSSAERLRIDLALLSALLAASEGYTMVYALGPYRRDLARFFSRLAARAHDAGHRAEVSLRVDGRLYRVTVGITQGAARLNFEGQG